MRMPFLPFTKADELAVENCLASSMYSLIATLGGRSLAKPVMIVAIVVFAPLGKRREPPPPHRLADLGHARLECGVYAFQRDERRAIGALENALAEHHRRRGCDVLRQRLGQPQSYYAALRQLLNLRLSLC